MSAPTLGCIGEEINLLIKQGCTLGPFRVQLCNPDATFMDLTNCTISGQLRLAPNDIDSVADLQCSVTDPTHGKFEFGLDDQTTGTIPAGDTVDAITYLWELNMRDSAGNVTPLYYGCAKIFRAVSHA
jgi:hypothetical protein